MIGFFRSPSQLTTMVTHIDDFMNTQQLHQKLQDKHIKLWVHEGNLRLDAPQGGMTLALRAELKANKAALIELLQNGNGLSLQRRGSRSPATRTLPALDRTQPHPASVVQQRLWFLDRMDPGTPVYNINTAYRLTGKLDVAAFKASINTIIARHEALRTTFSIENDSPIQIIAPKLELPLPLIDLSHLTHSEQDKMLNEQMNLFVNYRFNLAEGPLMRSAILRLSDREHVWIWTMHHIISDAWSMRIFNQELATLYAAHIAEKEAQLPPLPEQYLDYATRQHARLNSGRLLDKEAYWQQQLTDAPPLLELPTDRVRPLQQQYHGGYATMDLPSDLKEGLTRLSRTQNCTLFMTMLSAFKVLMHRLSGQEELIVGTPIAGRNRVELESMIGFFINTLALRTTISPEMQFVDLLTTVREVALTAYSNQEVPFERVLESLKLKRDLSHTPLFQVFFNLFTLDDAGLQLPEIHSEPLHAEVVHSNFDLTMYVREQKGQTQLRLVYNSSLFDHERMAEMLRQYEMLLTQIVAAPELPVGAYSLVTETARSHKGVAAVSRLPNPTLPLSDKWHGAIHDQFSQHAKKHPHQLALIDDQSEWSYQKLDQRSNQLAHYLLANEVGLGDIVAIYGHRSTALVWALLGIMKAGAAFTILDPAYPLKRLTYFMESAQPKGLIQLAAAGKMPTELETIIHDPTFGCSITLPDREASTSQNNLQAYPTTQTAVNITADTLSHIAFTSGSTGLPKGVMGRHGSLSHFLPWQKETFNLTSADRFSMLSGLSHDPLQRDIFTALWVGGTICIPTTDTIGTPGKLAAWMAEQEISFAHMTPPLAQMMTETAHSRNGAGAVTTIPSLRGTFFVGDKLTQQDVRRLQKIAPNVTCINSYGSTETQRAVSYDLIPADGSNKWRKAVYPLGRGMPDAQLLIMNKHQALAGIGEIGEIYMRSPHLALGYLHDPQRTAQRFLQNPLSNLPDDRLYRTGDLGRYLPNGLAEFAGRADRQVKIRGFRIEPGEIEVALSQHDAVQDAIVLLQQSTKRGEPRLLAYLVAPVNNRLDTQTLRTFLKQRLPDYMIPATYVWLDNVPLTPNGKVNYATLPQPTIGQSAIVQSPNGSHSTPPKGAVESKLASIWVELLELPAVGRDDNFFECGGHSLLAIRLFARIEAEFDVKLPLTTLFQSPTVAELAMVLQVNKGKRAYTRKGVRAVWDTLVPIQIGSNSKTPLFLIHGFGGGVVGYGELARLLGEDQPVYGLQSQGMDGILTPHERIEEMATQYVTEIQKQQPEGPYLLGGYCYGGVVAYEVARQLQLAGGEIAVLGVFEGYAPLTVEEQSSMWSSQAHMSNFLRNIPYWFTEYRQLGGMKMLAYMWRQTRKQIKLFGRRMGIKTTINIRDILTDDSEVPIAHRRVMEAQIRAKKQYQPPAYDGSITLFRTKARSLFRSHDTEMGWKKLGKMGVELRMIEGRHDNILERPFVISLARELRDVLENI